MIWEKAKASIPTEARGSGLFNAEPVPTGTGETREYSEIELEEYAKVKPQGDQAARARVQQGYSKVMRVKRFSMDIGITVEMRKYNKYSEVVRRLTNLGTLIPNRMELDLSHRITFGTATAYTNMDSDSIDITVGDTLALFSTAHTVRGSSTTYRNRLANNPQFSRGALEGMERLVTEETINQFGQKQVMPFDVIWHTDDPTTENAIREFLMSTSSVEQANSGVMNVFKGKYRVVKLSRVATDKDGAVDSTKRKYWGLASTMNSQAHLGIWEEPFLKSPASSGSNAEDFATENWNYGVAGAYGIAIVSAPWIKFSSGDGTA